VKDFSYLRSLVFEGFVHTKLITEWKNLIACWVVDYFVGVFVWDTNFWEEKQRK